MRYRLYIDESGNHDLKGSTDPNNRYLGLTGAIFNQEAAEQRLRKAVAYLKSFFPAPPAGSTVILHRKDIVNRYSPFDCLRDPAIAKRFDAGLMLAVRVLDYTAITVVIDKLEHLTRYRVWRMDPYHYCLEAMLERYCMFLDGVNGEGDVMIEARNKKLDKKLKGLYQHFYANGNQHFMASDFQRCLTSREIKMKQKSADVAGLQLADLISHPACICTCCRQAGEPLPDNFGGRVYRILEESKYRCAPWGEIDGWGRKWLP